jgi:Uma2 family endonuclease
MQPPGVILTYQDYQELPDDGKRYELHEGELSVTPAPSPEHQESLANLNDFIRQHVRTRGLGKVFFAPLDCILDDTTIVQPDLVYLDASRLGELSKRGIEGPPTLVVEVVSPTTRRTDQVRKLQLYAKYRVPYYWFVDPEARAIDAYVLDEAGGTYQLAARVSGLDAVSLPPFPDLALVPDSLWP